MSTNPNDAHSYIPPHIEQAMTQHLQQNIPAHLREYVDPKNPVYIPAHVEKQLSQAMQGNMPAHLQQYSDAFLAQRVQNAGLMSGAGTGMSGRTSNAVDQRRLGHSVPGLAQHTADINHVGGNQNLFQPDTQAPAQATGVAPQATALPAVAADERPISHSPYEFINQTGNHPPAANGIGTMPKWQLFAIAGGGLVILIAFLMIITHKSTDPLYLTIAQEQGEMARVSNLQARQFSSQSTENFATNTYLSMMSAQSDYLQFLGSYGVKLNSKTLSKSANPKTDAQLAAAKENGTLDNTYINIMRTDLTTYQQTLAAAARKFTGPKTHAELKKLYDQAGLLLQQSQQSSG